MLCGCYSECPIQLPMRRLVRAACCLGGLLLLAPGPARGAGLSDTWTFISAPQLHPPELRVLIRKPGLAHGYLMVGDRPNQHQPGTLSQGGPELIDSYTRPVWFLPSSGVAFDLEQETYLGKPVLVWYQGPPEFNRSGRGERGGLRTGEWLIYGEDYRKIGAIKARSPWETDLHDASIIGGDIWITVTREVGHQNLTAYGGPRDASVQDWGLQEFQISTGRLLRTWDPLSPGGKPNVPLSESHQRAKNGWDAYHLNSVQALPDGDLLVSMRNTWSVYLIDPRKDRVVWTLGGKDSSFHVSTTAQFAWQHDAELVNPSGNGQGRDVKLTLFDDDTDEGQAKGLILRLNTLTHRANLVMAYEHHPAYTAVFMGSMQALPNDNALVGWGSPNADFTEFSKSGKALLEAAWPFHAQSYRTLFTRHLGGDAVLPAEWRGARHDRLRELERRYAGRSLGGAGRDEHRRPRGRGVTSPHGL